MSYLNRVQSNYLRMCFRILWRFFPEVAWEIWNIGERKP